MLFEQCFAGQPSVNARDMAASWRPSYGEWLGAQAAEGFDRTITGRYLEEKGITGWQTEILRADSNGARIVIE